MWAYCRGKNAKIKTARMNIALPTHTTLCCPKHYGAVSGGQADLFKKMVLKKGFLKAF
jgi:hypothetical protein